MAAANWGSQLQIQIYVNRRSEELSESIVDALPPLKLKYPILQWVSPIECDNFREYCDYDFLRALELEAHCKALSEFWPRRGPCWDALAIVKSSSNSDFEGVVLVEAKSYPDEIYGPGCQASPRSREKIEAALDKTKEWMDIDKKFDWMGQLYQSANRLAHLYFFREVIRVPAWLVNVYFLNDPRSPTTREMWDGTLPLIDAELGLGGDNCFVGKVFLEARGPRGASLESQ
ncbi:MAG: hypothetical protein L0177_15920 [Chloroflexi bacterium]|nr:hypothetical protein [Chloroflexota bacterium]